MRVHVQPRIGCKLDISGLVSGFSIVMFISVCVHPCHALAEEKKQRMWGTHLRGNSEVEAPANR